MSKYFNSRFKVPHYAGMAYKSDALTPEQKAAKEKREKEIKSAQDAYDGFERDFEFIERDGDEFKHLFYKPLNKFIISIQKQPTIKMGYDGEDFKNNQVTVTCDYKYY